jgi:hypothetical protein
LIPLGAVLTVFAFVQAYRAIRRGDSNTANTMFRYRVGAQAFTVAAMVAGSMYYNKDRERTKELRKLKEQREGEEKRLKWIRELEARDEEEKAVRTMMEQRRAKAGGKGVSAPADETAPVAKGNSGGGGGGILASLGLWSKPADAAPEAKPVDAEAESSKKERNPRSSLGDLGAIIANKPGESDRKGGQDSSRK